MSFLMVYPGFDLQCEALRQSPGPGWPSWSWPTRPGQLELMSATTVLRKRELCKRFLSTRFCGEPGKQFTFFFAER